MFITAAPSDEHIRGLVLTALDSPEMAPGCGSARHRNRTCMPAFGLTRTS